jgi:zinc transport system ATP-binding protein
MTVAIEIDHVSVKLGDYLALNDISVSVDKGEYVAIVGPNGAGKSTLINAILGLVPLSKGSIRLFGTDASRTPENLIGYVPQLKTIDRNFPAVTCDLVFSGIRRRWPGWLKKKDHHEVEAALALVGAEHLCHKQLGQLSGGEIQRVYLARALIRHPKLLLLDEPATGVDAVGEERMYDILEDYMSDKEITAMIVTHDWLAAQHHATKALLLDRRLISYGPPSEALNDEHMRQAFGHLGHRHLNHKLDSNA